MIGMRLGSGLVAGWLLVLACVAADAAAPQESWIKPRADESLLLDVAGDDGRRVAVGERGHVLISDEPGSWRQVQAPTRVLLAAVDINEQGLGFAVGHQATILRTRDNGDSWERVYHAPQQQAPLLDVIIAGARRVIAVGAYGLYVESLDAGETWSQSVLEPNELEVAGDAGDNGDGEETLFYDLHLNDIADASGGRWYIAAEAGTAYRSDDDGKTWLRLPSPYEGSFFGVLPAGRDRVYLFGLRGRLFFSDDAGAGWQRIDTGTEATLSHALRLGDEQVLITGYAGVVLRGPGPDGGFARVILDKRPALTGGQVLDNGDLLSVGEGGIHRWPAGSLPGN